MPVSPGSSQSDPAGSTTTRPSDSSSPATPSSDPTRAVTQPVQTPAAVSPTATTPAATGPQTMTPTAVASPKPSSSGVTTAVQTKTPTPGSTTARPTRPPTVRPTATTTSRPTPAPTVKPTVPPTPIPTDSPTIAPTTGAESDFPAKNYGTFFRDQYGQNSEVTENEGGGLFIDTGSTAYGVALVRIDSIPASKRVKVIVIANKASYQYNIVERNKYIGIPLQLGNGTYSLTIYEQVEGTSYTPVMAHTFAVSLASSLKPYTAASIISDFSRSSACVGKAGSLCGGLTTQTGRVEAVYTWIVNNITYDQALAASINKDKSLYDTYLPDPDRTYSTRKGICYDYASLMCAMLRSQGIPTRMIKGSTPLGYHAWNEVYFAGHGWVIVAAFSWKEIDGAGWVLFDSTWAAAGWSPEKIISTAHTKQRTY